MAKKSELWVAAGGDELTCSVSLHHDGMQPHIRIVLCGTVALHNTYVTNILLASVLNTDYAHAEIDVKELAFFDHGHVNQHAVECLLMVVTAVTHNKRAVVLQISDGHVRDVLEDVLGSTAVFHHSVFLQADDSAVPSRMARALRAPLSMRAFSAAVGGRMPTPRRPLSDYFVAAVSHA